MATETGISGRRARGVGTILKDTFASFGIYSDPGCSCELVAQEMDRTKVEDIEKNIAKWVVKMKDSFKQWKKEKKVPIPVPSSYILKEFIEYACRKNRQEASEYSVNSSSLA